MTYVSLTPLDLALAAVLILVNAGVSIAFRLGLERTLLLTTARFDGTEAGRLGFAHFVVEDAGALASKAAEILAQARQGAPGAIARTKAIINATDQLEGDALVRFAAEQFADALLGEEAREGLAAFAEKRKAAWTQAS